MAVTYLITRPEHDDTTHYLSNWSKETIDLAKTKGFNVLDLHKEKAVKTEVEGRIAKSAPKLVVFNGHGGDDTVTGHKNQPLVTAGENEGILKSKIVYAISCKSAKRLGPESIKSGAISYTGYDDDFIFVYEPEKASRPLSDKTAGLFLEPSQRLIESLIKGNTVEESNERAKTMLKENMLKLMGGNTPNTNITRFLWWDLKHLTTHGNQQAKI